MELLDILFAILVTQAGRGGIETEMEAERWKYQERERVTERRRHDRH